MTAAMGHRLFVVLAAALVALAGTAGAGSVSALSAAGNRTPVVLRTPAAQAQGGQTGTMSGRYGSSWYGTR